MLVRQNSNCQEYFFKIIRFVYELYFIYNFASFSNKIRTLLDGYINETPVQLVNFTGYFIIFRLFNQCVQNYIKCLFHCKYNCFPHVSKQLVHNDSPMSILIQILLFFALVLLYISRSDRLLQQYKPRIIFYWAATCKLSYGSISPFSFWIESAVQTTPWQSSINSFRFDTVQKCI